MARRASRTVKRETPPDAVYGDPVVTKFINCLMHDGKKGTAERLFYGALEEIKKKDETKDGYDVFKQAIENIQPQLEVRSRRVGGVTYQVPVSIRPERRMALAIRWLAAACRSRNEYGMEKRMAAEFTDASKGTGTAMRKKEDTRKMADANKAFAHYRW